MPCSRSGGGVSKHALQVSRPTPKGEVEGDLARRVPAPGAVPAPRGCLFWGACSWGGACSGGCLLPRVCGDPPVTATAASGSHPTGMHSCLL